MSSAGRSIRPEGAKNGQSSVRPPLGDGGPIIEESQESEEYQQDLKVVVGTTIGVIAFVGLMVVAVLLYRVYRSRQRALAYAQQNDSLDRNVSLDVLEKCQPVVFLLYANDCPLHQRVVEALAGFLMEVCGATVTLDILEEADIIERGIDDWLVDRLQEAEYIMVMCSLGARLRCSKKHVRFKSIGQRLLPDYFSVAVDYVAEKMRVEKQKGLSTDKFLAVYMNYSTQSDIPPQLEAAPSFCLMRDIHKLHMHLRTTGPESVKSDNGSQHSGDCESRYYETETGAVLKATIEQTKAYFKENPSWMDDRLEQSSTVPHWVGMGKSSSRKRQHNSVEQPLLLLTNSLPPSQSTHEFERNQKRSSSNNPRWSSKLTTDIDVANQMSSSMLDIDKHHHHNEIHSKSSLSKSGIFQGRQNSLPSSLASSGVITTPAKKDHVFRSMDNFSNGERTTDHDGVPCLFCGDCHMEGVPECKILNGLTSLPKYSKHNDSMHNLHSSSLNNFSHSQTILQAEVHQEWGTPIRTLHSKDCNNIKSNTFGGQLRHWDPNNLDTIPLSPPAYKSLPVNQPPTSSSLVSDWDGFVINGKHTDDFLYQRGRTLSQSSIFTNGSESAISDADSLKRDLQSIQNISSFQDFINSSLFVRQSRTNDRLNDSHLLPSLTSSNFLQPCQSFCQSIQRKQDELVSTEIEMSQLGVEIQPVV